MQECQPSSSFKPATTEQGQSRCIYTFDYKASATQPKLKIETMLRHVHQLFRFDWRREGTFILVDLSHMMLCFHPISQHFS